jgi:hypothetical protein
MIISYLDGKALGKAHVLVAVTVGILERVPLLIEVVCRRSVHGVPFF